MNLINDFSSAFLTFKSSRKAKNIVITMIDWLWLHIHNESIYKHVYNIFWKSLICVVYLLILNIFCTHIQLYMYTEQKPKELPRKTKFRTYIFSRLYLYNVCVRDDLAAVLCVNIMFVVLQVKLIEKWNVFEVKKCKYKNKVKRKSNFHFIKTFSKYNTFFFFKREVTLSNIHKDDSTLYNKHIDILYFRILLCFISLYVHFGI